MSLIARTKATIADLLLPWRTGKERRADQRLRASACVCLAWTDDRGRNEVDGQFIDVSRGGAALRVTGLAPGIGTVIQLIVGDGPGHCAVEAAVRGRLAAPDGTTVLRLKFRQRWSSRAVEDLAGAKLHRRSRQFRPAGQEWLEPRQLLAVTMVAPQAIVGPEVVATTTLTAAVTTDTVYSLSNDPLLSTLLYSKPSRMASQIAPDGAIGVNAKWEVGTSTTWYIEQQRYGADFVQAGLVQGNAALVAQGWQILDWGFAHQAADGSFPGTGDAFHSTSMFVEAAARALLLTEQAQAPDAPGLIAKYLPKLEAAAQWLTTPSVATLGNAYDAPYTHRCWLLAAALGETAAAVRGAGTAATDTAVALAGTFDQTAATYAAQGLALQTATGVNPELGGSDTSYQAYGCLLAERYLTTISSATLQAQVENMVVRGLDWLSSQIDAQGNVATADNTRTGIEDSRSGTVKTIDYKTMIQAFSLATTISNDPAYRIVATHLAQGRGWM